MTKRSLQVGNESYAPVSSPRFQQKRKDLDSVLNEQCDASLDMFGSTFTYTKNYTKRTQLAGSLDQQHKLFQAANDAEYNSKLSYRSSVQWAKNNQVVKDKGQSDTLVTFGADRGHALLEQHSLDSAFNKRHVKKR